MFTHALVTAFSVFVFLCFSRNASPQIVPDGLVAYWTFDEGSGTTAADSSGNGNTAILENGTAWSTGIIGAGSVRMDGVDDRAIIRTASFGGAGDMTIAAWVNPVATQWSNFILDMLSNRDHVWLGVEQRGEKRLCFENGSNGTLCASMDPSYFGQWVHVAVTRPARGAGTTLYINGEAVAHGDVGADIDGATWWAIGDTPDFVGGRSFNGQIDDLRVYKRVLSGAELLQLANVPVTPASAPGERRQLAETELINLSVAGCVNKRALFIPGNQGRPAAAYDLRNIYVTYLTNESPPRVVVVKYNALTRQCSAPAFINTTTINSAAMSHDTSSVYVDGNGHLIVTYGGYTQVGKAGNPSAPLMRRSVNPNDLSQWGPEQAVNLWNYAETNGLTLRDGSVAIVGHDLQTRLDVVETNGSHRFHEYMQVVAQDINDFSGSLCGSGVSWNRFTKGVLAGGKEPGSTQKLYVLWGWTGNEANCTDNRSYWLDSHGTYFAYSSDGGRTWKNRAGTKTVEAFQCADNTICNDNRTGIGIAHNDEAFRISNLRQKEHRGMWVDEDGTVYAALERSNWCDTPVTPCYSQGANSPDALVFLKFQVGTGAIAETVVNKSRHTFIGGIRKDGSTGKLYIWALRNDATPVEYVSSDDGATWDGGTNIGGPGFTAGRMQGQTDTWWRYAALIVLQGPGDAVYLYRRSFPAPDFRRNGEPSHGFMPR